MDRVRIRFRMRNRNRVRSRVRVNHRAIFDANTKINKLM